MKTIVKMLKTALLVVILASLAGCESQKFETIKDPIAIGNKTYTALLTERVNPWGTNAVTLSLVESDAEQQPQQYVVQPLAPAPCLPQACLVPAPQQTLVVCQPTPQTNTHVVNNNNQGSIGWANGAFQGSVGDAIEGGCSIGAAAVRRPSRISVKVAEGPSGGGSSSSSSSSASSSAASGP